MKKERAEGIKSDVEREFPNDFALQQVHINCLPRKQKKKE